MRLRLTTLLPGFIAALMLYNTLLIGGGRGPFALNKDYWVCHCSDTEVVAVDPDGLMEPEIIALRSAREASLLGEEFCLARSDVKSDKVCKTKLPLRYISLLLSGSFVIEAPSVPLFGGLYFPFSSIISDCDAIPPSGIAIDLIRPPRFLFV